MRDESNKLKIFTRRAFFLGIMKFFLLFLLFSRYYYLQIIESIKYKTLSDKNRIKLSIIPPIRGKILDRNKHEIVSNRLTYRISIESQDFNEIKNIIPKAGFKMTFHFWQIKIGT